MFVKYETSSPNYMKAPKAILYTQAYSRLFNRQWQMLNLFLSE